jgi:hypothetical protein
MEYDFVLRPQIPSNRQDKEILSLRTGKGRRMGGIKKQKKTKADIE